MTIDQITDTVRDQEARDHIRRQYQSDMRIFGEREAIEFARFRADAAADAAASLTAAVKKARSQFGKGCRIKIWLEDECVKSFVTRQ